MRNSFFLIPMLALASAPSFAAQGLVDCQFQVADSRPVPADQKRHYISHPTVAPNQGPFTFGVGPASSGQLFHHREETQELIDGGWLYSGIALVPPRAMREFLRAPELVRETPSNRSLLKLSDEHLLRLQNHRPLKYDYLVQAHYRFNGPSTLLVAREVNWVGNDDDIQLGAYQPRVKKQLVTLTPDLMDKPIEVLGLEGVCHFTPEP